MELGKPGAAGQLHAHEQGVEEARAGVAEIARAQDEQRREQAVLGQEEQRHAAQQRPDRRRQQAVVKVQPLRYAFSQNLRAPGPGQDPRVGRRIFAARRR